MSVLTGAGSTSGTDPDPDTGSPERSPSRWLRLVLPALLVVVWLAVGGIGGPVQGQLADVQSNDNAAFLPADAEATRAADAQLAFADERSVSAIAVFERAGGLTPDDLDLIGERVADVGALPGLADRVSPAIPATDGEAAQVVVAVPEELRDQLTEVVTELRSTLGTGLPDGLTVYVAGPAGLLGDLVTAFGGIDGLLLLVAGGVVALILVLVYRSPLLPLLVLSCALLALCLAVLVVYQLAAADVIALSGQTQGILFILVVGAATDYALLLVARYREELRRHASTWVAMRTAYRASIEPIVASAGTVALGLLCLLLSGLNSNRGLGPVAAIGIAAAVLAALTFLPAALLLTGRAAFWPFRPHVGSEADERSGLWNRVADTVARRPRAIWVGTALVLLAGAALVPQLRASGVAQSDFFVDKSAVESVRGQEVLGQHFPGGTGAPAVIIASADVEDRVVDAAAGVEGVSEVRRAADRVVDGRVELAAVLDAAPDSEEAVATVAQLREAVRAVPGADPLVGGITATQLDTQEAAERDLLVVIPAVLLVVFIVLALLLRALVAPLLLIATVVLSFAATLGVGAIVFNDLLELPGADPSVPLFAFVFLVALGVDYNIFLMSRVREEARRHGTREGVRRGLAVTGGVITSAGVVLAATFAALAVIPILFLLQIAVLVAFGVLLDTLVVRSLLVPALSSDIGRRIWWPSALGRGKH
ncbi:MMPL family transporter [Pseudonocardia lacus]|uniref:MMPL family transporter n=1 Tax=Pseudonocardia lacus TaxID=2835865 RepID=UPI001BDD1B37|nr:MMPL family transporter [Pseudonocardia lacus]